MCDRIERTSNKRPTNLYPDLTLLWVSFLTNKIRANNTIMLQDFTSNLLNVSHILGHIDLFLWKDVLTSNHSIVSLLEFVWKTSFFTQSKKDTFMPETIVTITCFSKWLKCFIMIRI